MPWRRRYKNYGYYRRRRFWPWRPRPTFRRRRRTRRRKVRYYIPKKLKRITLKEWQPHSIRKCKVEGLLCLLIANGKRHGNNYTLYQKSIVPPHLPGGGCFSIMKFSLGMLYDEHKYCRNWWTASNKELPLIKYLGCRMKLYQCEHIDYAFRYNNNFPFTATNLMYASTQPGMMLMMKNTIIVPSKQTQKRKRPYKMVTIKPPSQFNNGWYFQQDLVNTGLFLTYTSACSLDEYYISSQSESNNTSIFSLNTQLFLNRQFHTNTEPNGYATRTIGTQTTYLYASISTNPNIHDIGNIIPLIETRNRKHGYAFNSNENPDKQWNNWKNGPPAASWGNPFLPEYSEQQTPVYYSHKSPQQLFNQNTSNISVASDLTQLSSQIFWELRYNPDKDDGTTNKCYLLSNWENKQGWEEPSNKKLIFEGFPLWILLHGYLDFQKRLAEINQIDTHYIIVIQTKATTPQATYIVPIGRDFIKGNSPYENTHNPLDENKWYPMVQYQEQSINNTLITGPGTVKMNSLKSEDVKCKYKFYFKFGGNPPPMTDVINPQAQPIFPIPHNQQQTTSLQNPTTPIQYYLSNFDQRRYELTNAATKRIKKDFEPKETIFSDSRSNRDISPQTTKPQTSDSEATSEEETQDTLYEQLQQQRNKQKRIKRRILKLISEIQKSK
nr:MAG: ORF1 [TTV-like mini virus]